MYSDSISAHSFYILALKSYCEVVFNAKGKKYQEGVAKDGAEKTIMHRINMLLISSLIELWSSLNSSNHL